MEKYPGGSLIHMEPPAKTDSCFRARRITLERDFYVISSLNYPRAFLPLRQTSLAAPSGTCRPPDASGTPVAADGKRKSTHIGAGIEHQEKRALSVFLDQAGKLLCFRVGPVGQIPLRAEPMDLGVRVELLLTQNRMRSTKGDHAAGKPVNLPVLFQIAPVIPTGFIVLAVGVVVAALRAAKFVPAEQHRHPARDQQGQQEILDLAFPQDFDPGIRRLAFSAVVLAEVGVGPVMVVFSVCFVVLVRDSSPGRSE